MEKYSKMINDIVLSISRVIKNFKYNTKQDIDKIDLIILVQDLESQIRQLKKIIERID